MELDRKTLGDIHQAARDLVDKHFGRLGVDEYQNLADAAYDLCALLDKTEWITIYHCEEMLDDGTHETVTRKITKAEARARAKEELIRRNPGTATGSENVVGNRVGPEESPIPGDGQSA